MAENSFIVLSSQTDSLWQNYLPAHSFLLDAGMVGKTGQYPHLYNLIGWRRWLKSHRISEVHLYQPDQKLFPLLAAAAALPLAVTIHITGRMEAGMLRSVKWLAPRSARFCCAGHFLARSLKDSGISDDRIALDLPIPTIEPISDANRSDLRSQIKYNSGTDSVPFLILALARPGNTHALRTVCWACAVLYHLQKNIKLVVAGPCRKTDWDRIEAWQHMWNVNNMILLDQQHTWDQWVAACDAVLVGGENLREVIRLLHVQAAGRNLVVQSGDTDEFMAKSDCGRIVTEPGARPLAVALLSVLEPAGKA